MLASGSAVRSLLPIPQMRDMLGVAVTKSPTAAAIVSTASALTGFSQDSHAEVAKPRLNLQTLFGSVSPCSLVPRALAELSPTSRNTLFNTHNCEPETILQVIKSDGSLDLSAKSSSKSDDSADKKTTFVLAVHPATPYPFSAIARLNEKQPESILKGTVANMNAKRSHPAFPPARQQPEHHVAFSDEVAVIDEAMERQRFLTPGTPAMVIPSPRYSNTHLDGTLDRALHPLRQAAKSKMLSSLSTMLAKEPTLQSRFSSTTSEGSSFGAVTSVTNVSSSTPGTPDAKKPRLQKHSALFDSYAGETDENWAPEGVYADELRVRIDAA